ncbi:hypothetical protein [Labrys wisconsinensis]|uniref:Ankyrin repeat domain-containing protein n=1 Tax=Labrys wisconsinensis TaxID=425677 RepID=A0ABU0JBS2_9HYPH|nr:hypothetical protein [Labrys wisconsinensis]MDQ0470597.1 hypothetical protein [Labrys wisconsinensis]
MLRRVAFSAALVMLLAAPAFAAGEVGAQPQAAPGAAAPPADAKPPVAAPATPAPDASADEPADHGTPQVFYGEDGLPDKVKELRRRIIAACKTGDLEALRPVLESGETPPSLSGGDSDDPIATLKLLSGDDKGREILAILLDVMEAGYVHVDVGTPQEMYVWPYFARYKLDKLTGPQMVELFRLITAGDFQDMQDKGVYSFYRAGIGPDGTWHYFEDGD